MSWLSDIGHAIGGIIKNPVVDAIIGLTPLGPLGGLAAGALGGLIAPGGNLGSTVSGGLEGGLAGLGGSALGGLATGGITGLENALKNIPGLGGVASLASALGLGNGAGGLDFGKVAALGLSGAQIANVANLQNKANQYAQQALSGVQQNYAQRQPLRQFGMQSMLQPQIADLSGLLTNSGPYAAGLPRPSVQAVQRYAGTVPAVT